MRLRVCTSAYLALAPNARAAGTQRWHKAMRLKVVDHIASQVQDMALCAYGKGWGHAGACAVNASAWNPWDWNDHAHLATLVYSVRFLAISPSLSHVLPASLLLTSMPRREHNTQPQLLHHRKPTHGCISP